MLALLGGSAVALLGPADPVSAANVAVDQCNGVFNDDAQTILCTVAVENFLTDDPATTGSIVTLNGVSSPFSSGNLVTSVTQCNGSGNAGGSTVQCTVSVTNTITQSGASPPTDATVNQCNTDQLGTGPSPCVPFPATTSGATITQCNGSGSGGGLVPGSGCTAGGTVSSTLQVLINQCNGSGNGGGGKVICSATIQTIVDDGSGPPTTAAGPTTTDVGVSTTDVGVSTTDVGVTTTDVGVTTTEAGAPTTGGPGTSAPSGGPGLAGTGTDPWVAVFAALLLGLGSLLYVVGRRTVRP